jgi:transposase-like protein
MPRLRPPAPYTAKPPARCPHCGATKLVRKGTRRKKYETLQLWRCGSCARVFTPAPPELRNKTYPLRVILDAVTFYNLGYTLEETAAKLRTRHGCRVALSTLADWIEESRKLATYARLREEGTRLYPPVKAIRTVKLYHRQVYEYAYHRPKIALLAESRQHGGLARAIGAYLEAVPEACPHDLFTDSLRASQTAPAFLDPARLVARAKENAATRLAGYVIPSVGNNYLRHPALQRFMLVNDSVTVATEVPIWLTRADIAALERQHDLRLLPEGAPSDAVLTGHIDFLQVRNGAVHILDYKPDARTNRPFAQLVIYALALAHHTGLRLFDFTCAWFNQEQYCEFYPRTVLARVSRGL